MEIRHEVRSMVSGNWDAIFFDQKTGQIDRVRVMFVAAVACYQIFRDSNRRVCDRKYLWDNVLPVNLNDPCGDEFDLVDTPGYLGLIPPGEDPHNPVFGLEFPSNQGRDAA